MTNNTQHTDVMNALQQHGVFRFLLITKNLFLFMDTTIPTTVLLKESW